MPTVAIANTTKTAPPRFPYNALKDAVLGRDYDLSLVFVGDQRSRTLNRTYRGKDKPTNVLSFALSPTEGEIIITPTQVRRDAPLFGVSPTRFTAHLFIHGLFHLKGLDHGSTMDTQEHAIRTKFNLT